MNRLLLYCLGSFILISCTAGISKDPVALDSFFDDNSSKVWLINKVNKLDANVAFQQEGYKDVMIFYKSGKVMIQSLNTLGEKPGKTGYFFIDSEKKTMRIEFGLLNENWNFKMDEISLEKVILSPLPSSDFNYQLTIIPLPEFTF